MNWSLKPCATTTSTISSAHVSPLLDRLTSLPDELLIRIISLLPTKDAAATSVLSRRLLYVFSFITTLDFDVSPISFCFRHPYAIDRFPTFIAFVDHVLFSSYKSQYLSRFRLRLGVDLETWCFRGCSSRNGFFEDCLFDFSCQLVCLPDLKPAHLHAWNSFPLTRYGLRELDLCILLRDPGDFQLPPAIFMCETLEVLKLDVNLGLDLVSAMPSYRLPKLKLLHLCARFIDNDNLLPKLALSCPLLEDLTYVSITKHVHITSICSPSLRRLSLIMHKDFEGFEDDNPDIVHLCTPNLEYLECGDNQALEYSIPIMLCLVEATLWISYGISSVSHDSFKNTIELLRAVSYVQRLTLCDFFAGELGCDEANDQLPVFRNLNHLTLYFDPVEQLWDKFLWALLNCSPVLETIVFESQLGSGNSREEDDLYRLEDLKSEREFFRTAQVIPSCCRCHIKCIVIKIYYGSDRELAIVEFFLRHALVLEELVVCRALKSTHRSFPVPDQISVENALNNLPRASTTCSIQVF